MSNPAYLMTAQEYEATVVPVLKAYKAFLKKNKYFIPVHYGALPEWSYPELKELMEKGISLDKSSNAFKYETEYRKDRSQYEKYFESDWNYHVRGEYSIDVPADVIEKKKEYVKQLKQFFGEKIFSSLSSDSDLVKSNRKIVKYAIDRDIYTTLLKDGDVDIDLLEAIASSVEVRIPKRVSELGGATNSLNKKYDEIRAALPSVNREVLNRLIEQIKLSFKPLEDSIFERMVKRYKEVIDKFASETEMIPHYQLATKIEFHDRIFKIGKSEWRDGIKTKSGRESEREYWIGELTLLSNWESNLNKIVRDHVEGLKFSLISSIVENFNKITSPIEGYTVRHLAMSRSGEDFDGLLRFTFKNGGALTLKANAIGAGGYNIQKFHFRYITDFMDVLLPNGETIANPSLAIVIEHFSDKEASERLFNPYNRVQRAKSVQDLADAIYDHCKTKWEYSNVRKNFGREESSVTFKRYRDAANAKKKWQHGIYFDVKKPLPEMQQRAVQFLEEDNVPKPTTPVPPIGPEGGSNGNTDTGTDAPQSDAPADTAIPTDDSKYTDQLNEMQDELALLDAELQKTYDQLKTLAYTEAIPVKKRRAVISIRVHALKSLIIHQKNVIKAIASGGKLSIVSDKKGGTYHDIPDFTPVGTNRIIIDEDTVLTQPVPPYLPYINEEEFAHHQYTFDCIRIAPDTYILACNKYEEKKDIYPDPMGPVVEKEVPPEEIGYVLVTLDQLVLISQYYYIKAKAIEIKRAKEINDKLEESYDRIPESNRRNILEQSNYWTVLPESIKKKVSHSEYEMLSLQEKEALYKPYKRAPVKRIESGMDGDKMYRSFHNMYSRFIDPTAKITKGYAQQEAFDYWAEFRDMMKYKINDLRIQRIVDSEMRRIAEETSFGESNVSEVLREQYGILVKRQNGSDILPIEIEQIRIAWEMVNSTFGAISESAYQNRLKISHTGMTNVFASKAVGIFLPMVQTIAASAKYGEKQFQSTLAHESAHYIDFHIGKNANRRYASDNFESPAGILANAFRKSMNHISPSDYTNATKECFARAMEQYFAIENFGDEALVISADSKDKTPRPYFAEPNYVSKETYYQQIKPLVVSFLEKEQGFFKKRDGGAVSLAIDPNDYLPDVSIPTPDEVEQVSPYEGIGELNREIIEAQIDGLSIILKYKSAGERQEIQRQINALSSTLDLLAA